MRGNVSYALSDGNGNGKRLPSSKSKRSKGYDMAASLDKASLGRDINAYFTACDETAERVILKNGNVSYRQTPYTLAGLSEHLGIPQQRIRQSAGGSGRNGKLFADALRRIERYTVERALLGELQYSVAAMLLRELGSGEKLPPEEDAQSVVIVLDDPEGWGA